MVIENAETAIAFACKETRSSIVDYTVGPVFMQNGNGTHEWLIEFKVPPSNFQKFKEILDEKLQLINSDYHAKRKGT